MGDYVPDPELSQLVRDLNRAVRGEAQRTLGSGGEAALLQGLLELCASQGASDLLLAAGSAPAARIDGAVVLLDAPPLTASDLADALRSLLDPRSLRRLSAERILDLGFEREGLGRFRCNIHFQRGGVALAIRLLPSRVPPLEELNLPAVVARLAELRRGLVLVTGPAGSGKSTTLAALVRRIAEVRPGHLLTIEDPVEYRLEGGRGLVEQVEVGRDAPSFAAALRAALRQSPDVILVGEMRDLETIGIALTAAETGHLVLSSLHTGDSPQAVDRIVDAFPGGQKEIVRMQIAGSLQAVVSQVLLPAMPAGRVPACEVLLATDAVRHRIRKGEAHLLHQEITLGKGAGMIALEESLAARVREGKVRREDAAPWARHREEFDKHLEAR